MDIPSLTIDNLREGLLARRFSAVELTTEALRYAQAENPKTNAYLHFSPERALAGAKRVDEQLARGEDPGPLAGVPVAVKRRWIAGTAKSAPHYVRLKKLLANYVPALRRPGRHSFGIKSGRYPDRQNRICDVNLHAGSSNENSAFGPVRNPVALDRVPGGSSGGSAAVVAQGTAVVSLGSDTGGSVRQPASFCGVVGAMPTYGRVSRYGLTAFASSLDHVGPFARSVKDAATLLGVIAGHDPADSTSASVPVPDYSAALNEPVKGMKLGLPREYMRDATGETALLIARAVEKLQSVGCEVSEISLPATDSAIACYYIIATAEASSNLARYDGVRYTTRSANSATLAGMYRNTRGEGFGNECKRRIMLGTYVLSAGYYDAYYLKAQKVRALIARDFARAFETVDAVIAPVSPFPAFRIGEKVDDPLAMYLSDIYTITGSLAGIPAMSVPCGKTSEGLPVGLQIMTRHFDEGAMFRIAAAFEKLN